MSKRDEEIEIHLTEMTQDELKTTLQKLLADPQYEESDYTAMMEDIAGREGKWTYRQRQAVEKHLYFNARIWF